MLLSFDILHYRAVELRIVSFIFYTTIKPVEILKRNCNKRTLSIIPDPNNLKSSGKAATFIRNS
jgi:hypothetical protein